MARTVKEQHRAKLIEYMGDPSNDFPNRAEMALTVLGFAHKETLWRHFSPAELCEIEREALEIRRTKYNPEIAKVDKALMKKAAEGDTAAAKLIYQRFEGWSEKQITEHTGEITANLPELSKEDLLKIAAGK